MKPKVSWLMPVYHAEKTVGRAIHSMLNQTFQDFEIIIVLEPEDEETEKICMQYAQKDNRICILKNETRLGIAGALNAGLAISQGMYIARMDADDISYPERLERQVGYLQEHPETGLLGTNARIIKYGEAEQVRYDEIPDSETIRAWLLFETCFVHPTIMLRKKAYSWKYPIEEAEDYALFAEVISKVKMEILPEILVDYMETGENACIVNFKSSRESGYRVSRKAIQNELSIDTSTYDNSHFGWRYFDNMPVDPMQFLHDSIKLLQHIREQNEQQKVFDSDALDKILKNQWELSKWLVRPYNEIPQLYKSYRELGEKDIIQLKFQLGLYTDEKRKIILYGIGKDCETIVRQIEEKNALLIMFFCDSDKEKQGRGFHGKNIISPQQLKETFYDAIGITTSKYEKDIKDTLINRYSIQENRIYTLSANINDNVVAFHRRFIGRKQKYNQKRNGRCAWLFCAPDYGNLGDHAIAEAEHEFIRKRFGMELIEVPCAEYRSVAKQIVKQILPSDILLITGGGFLGSLWFDAEKQVRDIIQLFPQNPICIFPQTLYWEEGSRWKIERQQTAKIYCEHAGNLLICARDTKSEQLMHTYYSGCNICTFPDMTLSMDWSKYFSKEVRRGALLCLKDDKESVLSEQDKVFLEQIGILACGEVFSCTTSIIGYFEEEERVDLLKSKLSEFAKAELVITDRLHGVLFSAITGTPCIALANCNHKIYETSKWVKDINNIRYVENIQKIKPSIEEILRCQESNFTIKMWKELFDGLEQEIRNLVDNARK